MQRPSDTTSPADGRCCCGLHLRRRLPACEPHNLRVDGVVSPASPRLLKGFILAGDGPSWRQSVCVPLCGGPRCSGNAKRPQSSAVRWLCCACALSFSHLWGRIREKLHWELLQSTCKENRTAVKTHHRANYRGQNNMKLFASVMKYVINVQQEKYYTN